MTEKDPLKSTKVLAIWFLESDVRNNTLTKGRKRNKCVTRFTTRHRPFQLIADRVLSKTMRVLSLIKRSSWYKSAGVPPLTPLGWKIKARPYGCWIGTNFFLLLMKTVRSSEVGLHYGFFSFFMIMLINPSLL